MRQSLARYLPAFIRKKIERGRHLQAVISNTGWMMGDDIVRKAVGILIGVWLARYLGPQLYGEFSYAVAIVMIVSPITMLSHDFVIIRRIVQDPSNSSEVLGTSFMMMFAGGVAAFALAMAAIFLVRPEDHLVQWLVGILAACAVVRAFIAIEYWFESQMQWKFTVYAKTSAFLLLSVVKIGLILLKAPLVSFAWAALAEATLGSAGLLIVYLKRGHTIKTWRFSRTMAGSLLRDSWPLVFSALSTMLYMRIDQVMLGSMIGSRELGNYSAAVQVSEVWYFIPMVITSSIFPALVKVETSSEELFDAHMQKLYRVMAFFAYTIALPVSFFSKEIVQALFSSSYTDAGPLLTVLVWTGLFTALGSARNVLIIAKNWTKVNLVSTLLGCLMNIALNYYLIPQYGAMGAVLATFISYWFAVHGTCFLFKPLRKTGWMMTRAMFYPKFW